MRQTAPAAEPSGIEVDTLGETPTMPNLSFVETLIVITYRLATYMVNDIIDDPAMLAIIFC